jgi:hypothetical protein
MVRMTRFAGRRSLRVAELHFALSGGCLPPMVEFRCHYPSVGHAPQFREIVFVGSQNEHDFGVFLPCWITVDDDWFKVGGCTWAREELAAAAANNPVRRKRIRSLAAVTFTVSAPGLVLDTTHPATGAMFSTGGRMPLRFAYLTRFKLLNCRHDGSCTIPACTRDRLRRQMFPHERDHRTHGLHHFRENIIEIEVVACAPHQLLVTLHLVVEFLRLFGDQGADDCSDSSDARRGTATRDQNLSVFHGLASATHY